MAMIRARAKARVRARETRVMQTSNAREVITYAMRKQPPFL